MADSRWQRIDALFQQAVELDASEREAFLASSCADDVELRREVEELLAYADSDEDVIGEVVGAHAAEYVADQEPALAGERVDDTYELIREIGRGGMGAVFVAQRADDEFQQRVAVKLLAHSVGPDTERRFRGERQILADLNHPHIASLIDGGTTASGQPYLVMEHIDGVPIDVYCDRHGLSIESRLLLFRKVAQAVHYAHRHLVVHRDIKPANILVTEDGEPKLLDFGIATALDAESGRQRTATHLHPMTPAYASPEQILGEPATTATDIYALGVLLFELLSGHRCLDLEGKTAAEIERSVLQQVPRNPSTLAGRPSAGGVDGDDEGQSPTPERIAAARSTTVKQLIKRLRGDLDAICQKALRKEPEQRYASVQGLINDLDAHLEGRPLTAGSTSGLYRARKFVRRHRVSVSAGAAIALMLITTVVIATTMAHRAIEARELAESRRAQAEQLIDFMLGDLRQKLEPIGRLDILESVGEQAMDYFAKVSPEALSDDELNRRSQALYQIGDVRISQGKLTSAMTALRESLSLAQELAERHPDDPDYKLSLGASHFWVGYVHRRQGRLDEAKQSWQAYFKIANNLVEYDADNAKYLKELAYAHSNLGMVAQDRGKLSKALGHFRAELEYKSKARELDASMVDRGDLADVHNNIGYVLERQGKLGEALGYYRDQLKLQTQALAARPQDTNVKRRVSKAHNFLGRLFRITGRSQMAIRHYERNLELVRKLHAVDETNHRYKRMLAIALTNVGLIEAQDGEYGDALSKLSEAIELMEKAHGRDPSNQRWRLDLGRILTRRARVYLAVGAQAKAVQDARRALVSLNENDAGGAPDSDERRMRMAEANLVLARAAKSGGKELGPHDEYITQAVQLMRPVVYDTTGWDFLDPWARALILANRRDEARRVVRTLSDMGYREPAFVSFCLEHGMQDSKLATRSP